MHYEIETSIDRPVDVVFAFMTRFDSSQRLMDEVVDSGKVTEGPVGLGTVISERVKSGPASEDISWEITAFEENELCTFEADTSFGPTRVSYSFEAREGGSRVTAEINAQLKRVYRLGRPIIQYLHKRNRERYLAKIKVALEDSA